jgi:hypothetical protein
LKGTNSALPASQSIVRHGAAVVHLLIFRTRECFSGGACSAETDESRKECCRSSHEHQLVARTPVFGVRGSYLARSVNLKEERLPAGRIACHSGRNRRETKRVLSLVTRTAVGSAHPRLWGPRLLPCKKRKPSFRSLRGVTCGKLFCRE